jgi:MFS family permease
VSDRSIRRFASLPIFSSLRVRNSRLYFYGQLVSWSGTWMETVAQSILVLRLTNSGTILGLSIATRFAPLVLFGPWGGLIADRMNKRRVVYVTQTLSGLISIALAALVATDVVRLWMVLALSASLGTVNVFDTPTRQAMISELVPRSVLPNAVALNSVTVNFAKVLGGVLGGSVTTVLGLAGCFLVNGLSFGAVLITLAMMRTAEMVPSPPEPREPGQIRAGLRYIAARPSLSIPLFMVAFIGTLAWEFPVSLPLLAADTFGNAHNYSTMLAVMGIGAMAGGIASLANSAINHRALAIAAIGWGIAMIAGGFAPTLSLEYVALVFIGYGSISFNARAKTTIQLEAPPEMRGRVMAIWGLAWLGSTPVGGPLVGWVASEAGARWGLLIGGFPTLVVGICAYPLLSRIGQRRSEPELAAGAVAEEV